MVYAIWLWSFALLFFFAERFWPRARRPLVRRGLFTDLGYLIFNSEYLGVLSGIASARLSPPSRWISTAPPCSPRCRCSPNSR